MRFTGEEDRGFSDSLRALDSSASQSSSAFGLLSWGLIENPVGVLTPACTPYFYSRPMAGYKNMEHRGFETERVFDFLLDIPGTFIKSYINNNSRKEAPAIPLLSGR